MIRVFFRGVLYLIIASNLSACDSGFSSGGGGDGDGDADADSDSDSDSDGDTDAPDCEGGKYDESTGLCWQDPEIDGLSSWQEAMDYCDGLGLAGHDDWYLPSRDDFIDLLGGCDSAALSGEDEGDCSSCSESDACSALFGSDFSTYFTSSMYSDGYCWYVVLSNGSVYVNMTEISGPSVRCVR
jgi:hypothetical protein